MFPAGGIATTWNRTEPLITPEKLRTKHLFGIPLVSALKDPTTGRAMVMTPDLLQDYIDQAVATAELDTGLTVMPTQFDHSMPWDRCDYDSFGFFRLKNRPIASIESIVVNFANNGNIYVIPLEWVDTGNLYMGQVNLVPMTIALTAGGAQAIPTAPSGALMLAVFQGKGTYWMGSFWRFQYTCGFPNGLIPKVLNDLIGCIAAMEILSQLAATYGKTSGSSMSIDGMSQSVSTPGPEIFTPRMKDLADKRTRLTKKIKILYGLNFLAGNV